MGTGKTTVGKELAALSGKKFYDLDKLIEEVAKLSIPEIFNKKGEPWFRQLESKILSDMSKRTNIVLSTGGGAVLNPNNRQIMKSNGIVIALTARIDTIWQRLKEDTERPLLKVINPRKTIEELYNKRASLYTDAHFIINVDGKAPEFVAEEILQLIKKNKGVFIH